MHDWDRAGQRSSGHRRLAVSATWSAPLTRAASMSPEQCVDGADRC